MILLHLARRGRRVRRGLVAAALIVASIVVFAGAADAHASLTATDPAPGSAVETSPDQIVLTFSEAVDVAPGAVRLFDATRRERAIDDARHGPTANVVTAALPTLDDGGYVVSWRVVSADGHPISGAFTFAIGEGTVGDDIAAAIADLQPSGASRANGVTAGVARAIAYGALALAVGATLVVALVWPYGFTDARTRRLLLAAGTVAVLAGLLALGGQGVNARGGELRDLFRARTWRDVVETRNGGWLSARVVALAALTAAWAIVAPGAMRTVRNVVAIGAAVGTAVCVALAGHASSGPHRTVSLAADIAHVLAFSVWIGGLALVVACVIPRASVEVARRVTAGFSQLAFGSVVVLVVSGSFMAWRQGVELRGLTETDYSTLLTVKVAVVAALVALGGLSRRMFGAGAVRARSVAPERPAVADPTDRTVTPDDGWRRALRRSISAEIALGVAVFAVSAMLVNASPPRADASEPVELRRAVAGLTLDVVVAPARTGPADLHVYVSSPTSVQPRVDELTVTVSQPDLGGTPLTVRMLRAGPAHFQSTGLVWPFTGDWTLTIAVQTDEFTRESTEASVTIRA